MMWQRYGRYLRRAPEVTVEWRDAESEARGWLVVNSFRGGAAGGGTRMRPGVTLREVVYLAKAMELKFALAGPAIGGAKAGIDFDPADPRKGEVLGRWYRAIAPYLQERYGTGGDLGVDEVTEVIPAIGQLGLGHPQEGIVRGHLRPEPEHFRRIIGNLQSGVAAPLQTPFGLEGVALTVSDMITGYGVAHSIVHYYRRRGEGVEGVRVLLEGFGNVGAACALYLARAGARIVAISDARSALIAPEGLGAPEVEELIRRRESKLIASDDPRLLPPAERGRFFEVTAEIFVCAAASGSVDESTLERLAAQGVRVIASGANHPFRERRIGSTRTAKLADRRFSILPDILANCGMARTFSYLMERGAEPHAVPIFAAVDRTIEEALDEICDRAGGRPTALLAATLGLGLDRVGAP
jgi:glutamate dehydrogenase (NAD(P)+)